MTTSFTNIHSKESTLAEQTFQSLNYGLDEKIEHE